MSTKRPFSPSVGSSTPKKRTAIIDLLNSSPHRSPPAPPPPQTYNISSSEEEDEDNDSDCSDVSVNTTTCADPHTYHVLRSIDYAEEYMGGEHDKPCGVYAFKKAANHAAKHALSEWGRSQFSDWNEKVDSDGLVRVKAKFDEGEGDASVKVVQKEWAPVVKKGTEASESWVLVEEGKVRGVHLSEGGAVKVMAKMLLERKRAEADGAVKYKISGNEGLRISVGSDGKEVKHTLIRAQRWDLKA